MLRLLGSSANIKIQHRSADVSGSGIEEENLIRSTFSTPLDADAEACALLFARWQDVSVISIESVTLDTVNATNHQTVKTIILRHVEFAQNTTLLDFLSHFSTLTTLEVEDVWYGSITSNDPTIPPSLRTLRITWPPNDSEPYLRDAWLKWMIKNPEKVPELMDLTLHGIVHDILNEVILVISIVQSSLTQLRLGVLDGAENNDDVEKKLRDYCTSHSMNFVLYRVEDTEAGDC